MTPENTVLAPTANSNNGELASSNSGISSSTQQPIRKATLTKVAIHQIWPNPQNPRSVYSLEDIQNLAANLKASGQRSPIKLVPLTELEKAQLQNGYEYKLLGGHMRREAALTLGWDSLDALIFDLTPDEAELEMILDNRVIELPWLDQYKVIEAYKAKNPTLSQEALGARLGVDQVTISRALKTLKYLNQGSRELVYSVCIKPGAALQGGKMVALALTALEDPEKVEQALRVALDRKMTEAQAKKLVEWVQGGNEPEAYKPAKEVRSSKLESSELKEQTHPHPSANIPLGQPSHIAQPKVLEQVKALTSNSSLRTSNSKAVPAPAANRQMSETETVLWSEAVGISIVSRIKAKIKKGERPNLFEVLILAVHTLGTGLAWVAKQVWKMAKPVAKVLWKLLKDGVKLTLKALGRTVYNLVRVVLVLTVLGLLGWFAWEFYKNGHHPRQALLTIGKTLIDWAVLLWRQG